MYFIFCWLLIVISYKMLLNINVLRWFLFDLRFTFSFSSILFFFILIIVVLSVFLFTSFYLSGELKFTYFFLVLLIFILRMVFLNFSRNLLSLLVSWDLLGISSYFLVLFYNNWDSNVGSINVALTNRLGDYFLFFVFSFLFVSSISFRSLIIFSFLPFIIILIGGFTKSAQFPFRRWLPKAIRAPTPVRALVHRSTLVTAGLILIINFNLLISNVFLSCVLSGIGFLTIGFSSVMALIEADIKKVVALRTLSQIGFSCLILGLSLNFFCLFHLLSHALFKSCLFIQIGFLIYNSFGQQDGRFYSLLKFSPFFIQFQILITLFCLCGLLFTRGLVRKDFVLEYFFFLSSKLHYVVLFYVFIFLTFYYSVRLWWSLFSKRTSSISFYNIRRSNYYISRVLVYFSICLIWFVNRNLIFRPLYQLHLEVFVPLLYVLFFFILIFVLNKLSSRVLSWSFLVDYYAKNYSFTLFNYRFFDFNLNNILSNLIINRFHVSFLFNRSIFNINVLILLIGAVFILLLL